MYLLLIALHIVFFVVASLLSSIVLQIIFVLLLVFFLFFFSSLFFVPNDSLLKKIEFKIPQIDISPKNSILIPLFLSYIGIYILIYSAYPFEIDRFEMHMHIFIFIYVFLLGYIFIFGSGSDFFTDILRVHLMGSYITLFFQIIFFFVLHDHLSWVSLLFSVLTQAFSVYFFRYSVYEKTTFFFMYSIGTIASIGIILAFLFPGIHIFTFFGFLSMVLIIGFEYFDRISFLSQYMVAGKVFLLSAILGITLILTVSPLLSYYSFVWFLVILGIFLISVHIRYCNYISYIIAIMSIFYLYGYLFFPLLQNGGIISVLLYIFFFPLCVIGNTYFWRERYTYDFSLLHYSSMIFSIIMVLYSFIFLGFGDQFLVFVSFSFFLFAFLFVLSYFRFRSR